MTDATSDRAILLARLNAAEDRTLDYWIDAVASSAAGSLTVKSLQETVSWRVTRPLRVAKIVYTHARRSGLRHTAGMIQERLAQLRQARKRG